MSGGLPRVTFDGGGKWVYISYTHLLLNFEIGSLYLSLIHLYRICRYGGAISKNSTLGGGVLINKVLSNSEKTPIL